MATDGNSKISFVNALRDAGTICNVCFVIFHYGIFQKSINLLLNQNIKLIELATWKDILIILKERGMNASDYKKVENLPKDIQDWAKRLDQAGIWPEGKSLQGFIDSHKVEEKVLRQQIKS